MKLDTPPGFVFITILCLAAVKATEEELRDKKHFSLFSVVTFKNEECSSESTFTGGVTHGTCYTASECSDKKGTKSGNCASGFGVCCIFIDKLATTATISENRTYLRNPTYPTAEATKPTDFTYTVKKTQSDICQVRLDFAHFVIGGPSNTGETGTDGTVTNCKDALTFKTTSGFMAPVLCGQMTDEHLYLDMGMVATDTVTLAFTWATTTILPLANAMRAWSIKTSQIPCWAPYRAPEGCHRYFMQTSGQIISPNFGRYSKDTATGTRAITTMLTGLDLQGQHIKSCIRREAGMCCTLFQVCVQYAGIDLISQVAGGAVATGSGGVISEGFSFQTDISAAGAGATGVGDANAGNEGIVDAQCTLDYVEIPDSSTGVQNFAAAVQVNTRYCGTKLGFQPSLTSNENMNAPIWDCTEPWEVTYHTDIFTDVGTVAGATQATIESRGLCLDFLQQAC
jgi:hypothetical protein